MVCGVGLRVLFALLVVEVIIKAGLVEAGWEGGSACDYKGYKPAGSGAEPVSPIPPTTVKSFEDALGYFFDKTGHLTNIASSTISLVEDASTKLTYVAKDFAVFSAFFAVTGFNEAPSANDIIERVNEALDGLVSSVNKALDDMTDYVDEKILQHDRTIVQREFTSLKIAITQCIGNYDNDDDQLECEQRTVDQIYQEQPSFEPFANAFDRYKRKKSNKEVTGHLSDDEVSQIEAIMALFQPWASLYLVNAKIVSGGYTKKGDSRGQKYMRKIKDYGMQFYEYCNWAYDEIYYNKVAQHKDKDGNLKKTWTDEGISTKYPSFWGYVKKEDAWVTDTAVCGCYPMKDGSSCKYSVSKTRTSQQYNLESWQKDEVRRAENAAKYDANNGVKGKCQKLADDFERDFKTYWAKVLLKPCSKFKVASDYAAKILDEPPSAKEIAAHKKADKSHSGKQTLEKGSKNYTQES